MPAILAFLLGVALWHLVGAIVLASIDREGRITAWADKAPYGLDTFILSAWPFIVYHYYRG
jgi:hypothetical protein